MVIRGAGHQHAAGLADLFQARRHVDPVAQQILALDHHIAKIDADPEHDPPLGRNPALPLGDILLDRHGAGDRVDHRAELDDRPVAHQLDDPAVALGEHRIDHRAPQFLDRRQRASFVRFDQARVADDVGRQDGREPPLRLGDRHGSRLQRNSSRWRGRPRGRTRRLW